MEQFSDYVNKLPDQIDLEKAKGIQAHLQFSVTGEGGGEWGVKVDDGKVLVEPGQLAKPQVVIKASSSDALRLMKGELNPMTAFMTGRLRVVGDIALAMKLLGLLK